MMLKTFKSSFLILFLLLAGQVIGQTLPATIYGVVKDSLGKPLPGVVVSVLGAPGGTSTNLNGEYSLPVDSNTAITIVFNFIGFKTEKVPVQLVAGERKEINKKLREISMQLPSVTVEDKSDRGSNVIKIDPKVISALPSASGNFESILKTLPGVASNNELSSQYNVRGGNYDENLVYVNDIEVYRPFLVRSGQQEGLSFINSAMISSISFSAGGFEAKYGDKMSSALDIKYKRPTEFGGTVEGSLLGGAINLEGTDKSKKFTYLIGARQKSNQYLLKTLDTKGDYKPSFSDLQSYISYKLSEKWELGFLGNYSNNVYLTVPQNRQTSFGTVNEALSLNVYFDGQEKDKYETFMGALSSTYQASNNLKLKFIASAYKTYESEAFDIQGQYYIDELEKNLGKKDFGKAVKNLGVGTFLNHARTDLQALVYNFEQKGYWTNKLHFIQWGARFQHEEIIDKLNEWRLNDSADYALPKPGNYYFPGNSSSPILLNDIIRSKNSLSSNRYSGFMQDTYSFTERSALTGGLRFNYWDLNKELLISPRLIYSYRPHWKNDFVLRASTGFYYQPPFYRELRDLNGNINKDLKAQRSIHYVVGADYNFKAWGRPFKYVGEIYYKQLDNLVPYKIDNVRIRYYANNNSHGYSTGIDMRVNGEFVPGAESWASLSILQTREDIIGDFYYIRRNAAGETIIPGFTSDQHAVDSTRHEPGYIPRPTDQMVTASIFFQDYLPKFPTFKVHLNLVFGSRLPFGPPGPDKFKDTLRMPPYRRVDIGFSKQLVGENSVVPPNMRFLKYIKSMWLSLEVFNLLQINNTVSYLWVSDINNRQYAVPNYLTARQINARLVVKF